jgi:apolipoprotein N-acyltransferase
MTPGFSCKILQHPITRTLCYGLALGLSAPGFGFWPLAWVALIPVLAQCRQVSAKGRFYHGLTLGAGFAGLYYLWFFDLHPLAWLGFGTIESRLITLAGWLLLVMETALITGLLILAYGYLKTDWQRVLIFPLLWVFGFACLNLTPMALPWAQLEYTQAQLWPMRWLMGLVTGSGLAGLMVLHNVLWAEWLNHITQPLSPVQTSRQMPSLLRPVLATLALPVLIGGLSLWPEPRWDHHPWPIPVGVIQGNLPIEVIRSGGLEEKTIARSYFQPLDQVHWPPGTLLVYPEEGVAPGWARAEAPKNHPMLNRLMGIARQRHLYIAVGISTVDQQNRQYNSLAVISPPNDLPPEKRVQYYHKRRLVPFGEFTPYGLGDGLSSLLNRLGIDYVTPYASGAKSQIIQTGRAKLGGLICFELIDSVPGWGGFAGQYRQLGANMLINSSNLGWFHQNPLLEAQFLAIGQVRAAETHLPLVISSNTGISAIISNQGQILQQTHPNRQNEAKSQVIFYNGS